MVLFQLMGEAGVEEGKGQKTPQNKGAGTDCMFTNIVALIIVISCRSEDRGLDSKEG